MVAEQEEEEGSLQWRIDAEVRLAMQEAQAGEAARLADLQVGRSSAELRHVHITMAPMYCAR